MIDDASDDGTVIARGVGSLARIRCEYTKAIHAVDHTGRLLEIIDGNVRVNATYAPGWTNFDAATGALYVDEGHGPVRFYERTRCGCRTRTVIREDAGKSPQPDATVLVHERWTCPVCRKTWIEDFVG